MTPDLLFEQTMGHPNSSAALGANELKIIKFYVYKLFLFFTSITPTQISYS
jgi:hypothetical protein